MGYLSGGPDGRPGRDGAGVKKPGMPGTFARRPERETGHDTLSRKHSPRSPSTRASPALIRMLTCGMVGW